MSSRRPVFARPPQSANSPSAAASPCSFVLVAAALAAGIGAGWLATEPFAAAAGSLRRDRVEAAPAHAQAAAPPPVAAALEHAQFQTHPIDEEVLRLAVERAPDPK